MDDNEKSSAELFAELKQMEAELAEANEVLKPIQDEIAAVNLEEKRAMEAYQAAISAARLKKRELDQKGFDYQVKVNALKSHMEMERRKAEEKARQEQAALAEQARQDELALLNERWDKLTAAAHWREWAKDHQISGGHTLTENRKVILADPMGLGKTLTSIIAADMAEAATRLTNEKFPFLGEEKQVYDYSTGEYQTKIVDAVTRPVGKRILYFCPSSLLRNVEKEFRMWSKHRSVTYIGGMSKAERQFALNFVIKNQPEFVVIINYEAWRKDLALLDELIGLNPDTVIIDEAHNVKNMKTSGYRGIRKILDEAQPEYVIPMTGTPILNRPQELFSLLTLVNPKEFHTENDFLYRYCEQDMQGYWKFQSGGLDRIEKKIRKNFLRRTRQQAGIQLPEKTVISHDLTVDEDLYPNQARVRKQMRETATIMIDEAEGKAIAATAMIAMFTRLRQVETWPAGIKIETKGKIGGKTVVIDTMQVDVEESQKVDYVIGKGPDEQGVWTGLIPEVIEDERVVVFSQFKAPLREIKRRIEQAGYRACIMDGDTPVAERELISTDFDARYTSDRSQSKYDVVLCNYRVGGVGLNLTAATQMVILDEEWNPGKRDQAYDRIHRIGQENAVTIHVIRDKNTIDDWLAGLMEFKEGVVDGFNNTMVGAADFKNALESGLI